MCYLLKKNGIKIIISTVIPVYRSKGMTHLFNTRFLILWHLSDTLCPFLEVI